MVRRTSAVPMRLPRLLPLAMAVLALTAGTTATLVPHAGPGAPTASTDEAHGGASALHADLGAPGGAAPLSGCATATYGAHQYRVCQVGHPAETDLASGPNGLVWALSGSMPQKTANAGASWTGVPLATPGTLGLVVVPEGDIAVAPDGAVYTNWLTVNWPEKAPVWKSTDGNSFKLLPGSVATVDGFPDRPWIVAGLPPPADPSNPLQPDPYAVVAEAGTAFKPHYVSGDGGTLWYPEVGSVGQIPSQALPAKAQRANPFLDYVKPFGQGMDVPTHYLVFGNGQFLSLASKQLTYDFNHWTTFPSAFTWPDTNTYPWWDVSSDGTIYAVGVTKVGTQWLVKYKWYDSAWHDGAITVPLAAQPSYNTGLSPTCSMEAAVKTHGALLGINTREKYQDVLIRITNASSAAPTYTKEAIGTGESGTLACTSTDRYDFAQLVFDSQGRAVVSFHGAWAAYAQTV